MKQKILKLEGISLLLKNQQKTIVGGAKLIVYNPDDQCQNATEVIPTGCPCSESLPCSRVYGSGAIGSGSGPVTVPGTCRNGFCA